MQRAEMEARRAEQARLREERRLALEQAALERARRRLEQERLRAERLREQAERARTRTRQRALTAKAETAEHREERIDELAARIERGEYTPSEIRELMKSGLLRFRNPAERALLTRAMALSARFHDTPIEVIELAPHERQLPRYVVALGEIPTITYEPDRHSARGEIIWEHQSGDRGDDAPPGQRRPILAIDPRTGRPLIVPFGSPMTFDPDRGLVG
jgi:anti-sigma28 factor (negative regulator of flagellin synthesis)